MPVRIQLRRTKGWRLPPAAVVVSRPTVFGNPFVVGRDGNAAECARRFRDWLTGPEPLPGCGRMIGGAWAAEWDGLRAKLLARLPELRGKDLACWCKPGEACHADVLLELANQPDLETR